ncbi:FtsX-like permease family protein [Kitasatospora sp. CM 4170]|uniref:ABC transporter permease n=1 Tax=Kitasatospora aburaviensis TaxID=67265 RepID=A0ABW1FA78_9ACTN|nr:FtsX-like permease family protein [Kitasatospora sp. CM 4170]WNM48354.1 FtsX-like permease family protein [Kitasatospora sp. CM 4170]
MSNGLARASVRFRPASFAGTFLALFFGAAVIMACGTLLQTGITASVPPVRYAAAPVVVAGDPAVSIEVEIGEDRDDVEQALPERARVDAALAGRIAAQPGVAAARPDTAFPVPADPASGLPVLTGRGFASVGIAGPEEKLVEGRAPGAGEVVLDADTARAAHLAPGAVVTLTAPGGSGGYRISGLVAQPATATAATTAPAGAAHPHPTAWFADPVADRISGHPGKVDAIAVQSRAGVEPKALAAQVRQAVGDSAEVLTGAARGTAETPALTESRAMLTGLGGSFGGVAAMTAVFAVMSTVALATGQRAREFALLRAIGATPRQIRRTIATEAVLVAPVAAALGILPGLALARWWFGEMADRGAVPGTVGLSVGPVPMLAAVVTCTLAALGAGFLAARRPSRLRPSQALGEAAVEPGRPGKVRTVAGLLFAAGAVSLAGVAAGLDGADAANTALGVVMCFLLATALLGPWVARAAAGLLGAPLRLGAGASGSLAADNSRANARRLASAITPIVMVTAFCGTLLFLQTTIGHVTGEQLRNGITADHVVGSAGPGLPAGTAEQAAKVPGVDAAVGVLRTGAVYRSGDTLATANALGIDGDPAELPRVIDLGVRSGSLADLGRSADTVALDAALAADLGVKVGDRAPLWLGDGTAVRPTVVATYERGLGFGQLLLPRAAVAEHVTAGYDSQVLVADAPGADRSAVAARLAALGAPSGGQAGQGGAKAGGGAQAGAGAVTVADRSGYVAQADRDREIGAWANTVMAGVLGGFAAVTAANTLVMTVLDRRREVALLRLAGTTRRQVRGMLRWEALLVAATGLLVGGVIAWITLVPITRGIAGAAPHIPAGTALPLAAGAVLLCLAATGLPGRALLRTRPVAAGGGRQ